MNLSSKNETLEVTKENALTAYEKAKKSGKALLENLFGKKVFQKDIMERIQTLDDVFQETGADPYRVVPYPNPESPEEKATNGYRLAMEICKAYKEGWEADFRDKTQPKYFAYFTPSDSGSGLSLDANGRWYSTAPAGSRLAWKNPDHIRDAFKKFPDVFADWQQL